MKLKKIASLALAGVMAVSMLAGCAGQETGTTNNGSSSEVTVSNSLAEKVIANLNSDITKKVTFSTGSDRLSLALEIAMEKLGNNDLSNLTGEKVLDVDGALGKKDALPIMENDQSQGITTANGTDSKTQKVLFVKHVNAGSDENAAYLLANAIDEQGVMVKTATSAWYTMSQLPTQSNPAKGSGSPDNYCWDFAYTAEIVVMKAANTTNNANSYVAAVVLTRTPTKNTNI